MSTPLLSHRHFGIVERSLNYHATTGRTKINCRPTASLFCEALGVTNLSDDPAEVTAVTAKLIGYWKKANTDAHNYRYEKPQKRSRRTFNKEEVLGLVGLLKALEAISCNCDGGAHSDMTIQSAVRRLNEIVIPKVTEAIIKSLPAYIGADWFL